MRKLVIGALAALALGAGCVDKGLDTGDGAAPNLVVSGLVCTQEGGDAVCDVIVENTGDADAGAFTVEIFTADGATLDAGDLSGLATGDVDSVTLTATGCAACAISARVDANDAVAEFDEGDNEFGPVSPVRRRR